MHFKKLHKSSNISSTVLSNLGFGTVISHVIGPVGDVEHKERPRVGYLDGPLDGVGQSLLLGGNLRVLGRQGVRAGDGLAVLSIALKQDHIYLIVPLPLRSLM